VKGGLVAGTAVFVAGVIVFMAQLWFAPWSGETFVKIEMTLGGLLLIVVVVWFVVTEYRKDKETRRGDRLD
jgi:uncharacterized membrane protein